MNDWFIKQFTGADRPFVWGAIFLVGACLTAATARRAYLKFVILRAEGAEARARKLRKILADLYDHPATRRLVIETLLDRRALQFNQLDRERLIDELLSGRLKFPGAAEEVDGIVLDLLSRRLHIPSKLRFELEAFDQGSYGTSRRGLILTTALGSLGFIVTAFAGVVLLSSVETLPQLGNPVERELESSLRVGDGLIMKSEYVAASSEYHRGLRLAERQLHAATSPSRKETYSSYTRRFRTRANLAFVGMERSKIELRR